MTGVSSESRYPRCGIVGAGRSRNGLGPFLATHFEAAGGRVVGIVGRDSARAVAAADFLVERLGHPVAAHSEIEGLLEEKLDVLIIAAPVPVHLPALRAARGAGVAVLCEKPIGMPDQAAAVSQVLDQYLAAEQLLVENCQWPEVLPAWRELHPEQVGLPVREVTMGLAPSAATGMLEDSLSHLLSVVQALVPVEAQTSVAGLRVSALPGEGGGQAFEFGLETSMGPVGCRLELQPCEHQPRPAWLAINGARMDREIEAETYQLSFRTDHRSINTGDPSADLVYRFIQCVREVCSHERIRTESDSIRQRARVYHHLVDGYRREP